MTTTATADRVRLTTAVLVASAVVLSAPFIRDIRDFIKTTFPGHYVTVVIGVIAVLVAAAMLAAFGRIRDRRLARYGAIAAAFVLATSYALWNAQGNLEVDAVERFHFVEYGLVTFLFYRAFRPYADIAVVVLTIAAGLIVGTCEEWLQWFIPGRVGDMRDIFLNGAAIASGLLFSIGVDPPEVSLFRVRPGSMRRIGAAVAVVSIVIGLFVHSVHLGTEINDPETGRFRSRYDAETLLEIGRARAVEWKVAPPLARPASLSREDQYLSEGHLHVQERNRKWADENFTAAWTENLILEKYYAPVLDTPSYLSKTGHRWNEAQREDGRRRFEAMNMSPASQVSQGDVSEGRHFIRTWPPLYLWGVVALIVAAAIAAGTLRPASPQPSPPPAAG